MSNLDIEMLLSRKKVILFQEEEEKLCLGLLLAVLAGVSGLQSRQRSPQPAATVHTPTFAFK